MEADERSFKVVVADMQPIEPPIGGGRLRLLGLYHGLGSRLPTLYVGSYDWPGEKRRRIRLSETLEEVTIPLGDEHFAVAADWRRRVGGKTIIDTSFPQLAHLSTDYLEGVRREIETADIVVFSHPWVYPFASDILDRESVLVVYDSQNVEGFLRTVLLDDGGFGTEIVRQAALVEYRLCHDADLILACSNEDRRLFHRLYEVPFSKILVVPNGTFTTAIRPVGPLRREAAKSRLGLPNRHLAIFLASLYPPNVEAAEFICDELAPLFPDLTFAVCGGVGDALTEGAKRRPNVHVTGVLDEDRKLAFLEAADLAVNPMFSGSGTNIKMFDFMAAGLPIVTTPIGARGIPERAEPPFVVATREGFEEALRRAVRDNSYARGLGETARMLAESSYAWERISAGLGTVLHRARSRMGKRPPFASVIVATYERHRQLEQLLACLQRQSDTEFEVIIVDQSRAPWGRENAEFDLDLLYIHTEIRGPARARNTAAMCARGDVLAFTDDDCQPFPNWLVAARPYFEDTCVVGVEGLILSDRLDDPNFRPVTNVGFEGIGFMTANLFLRRETFMAIDGFDEAFAFPFREDTDLAWRALRRGEIPFGREVRVFHPAQPRGRAREGTAERSRLFQQDALLLRKHPERYKQLFLREGHYLRSEAFRANFLAGVEKYGVELDEFYLSRLAESELSC
jgi:glycosyltransferase involved in cell wall biosynthesis